MDITDTNKILIIRFSSLGDVLLTTPVVRAIKKSNPKTEIYFLVMEGFSDVVKSNPAIFKVVTYNKNIELSVLISELKETGFDLVIDLQNNKRSRKIINSIGVPAQRYIKPTLNKILLVKFGWNRYKEILTIPEMYAANLKNVVLDDKGLDFYSESGEYKREEEVHNNVALCVGAKHFTKRYPAEYFVQLGNMLAAEGYNIFVFGGKNERELCSEISGKIKGAKDVSTNDDLFDTAKKLNLCKYVFTNDSGLMHLASALSKNIIAFFGSSVKEFGFLPYKSNNLVLENNSLSCRPCSHIGRKKCPKKHFECMRSLTPDIVMAEFKKNIENK